MASAFNALDSVMLAISDILYRPWFVPLLLLAGGLYFTIRTKFIQGRMFVVCSKKQFG